MTALFLILTALVVNGGVYASLEALLGETLAMGLCPVGWAVIVGATAILSSLVD